jgi:choline kinase
MNIAVILSGGIGTRMQSSCPKQYIMVKDKPIIIYTMEVFAKREDINKFIVVIADCNEKKLNHASLVTFNEKLQWLKLHCKEECYTQLVDKFEVKKIIADIVGEEYIIQHWVYGNSLMILILINFLINLF